MADESGIRGVASWLKVRNDPSARAHAGRMTGHEQHGDTQDREE